MQAHAILYPIFDDRWATYYLLTVTVVISFRSAVVVWLCCDMDPRGAILLDKTIHSLDCTVCPVSVWYGGQCVVHLSTCGQAPNNEGMFFSVENGYWTNFIRATTYTQYSTLLMISFLTTLAWHLYLHLQLRCWVSSLRNPECVRSNRHY